MKLDTTDLSATTLASIGKEAATLVLKNDFASLFSRFGYALAFNRDPVLAIRHDIECCLGELSASEFIEPDQFEVRVTYYREATRTPYGLIECLLPTDGLRSILMELLVTIKDDEGYVTLEQFSGAT